MTGLAVRPRLLSEEIYSTLRNAIVEERLPPGMKIVEERLAGELGVSRIPLREALHKLERDGFVESLAHRGFRVVAFTDSEIRQIYEIRRSLEIPAAVKAVAGRTESGLRQAELALTALGDAAQSDDPLAIVGKHVAFHLALYAMGDNARLVQILGPFMELGFTARVARQIAADGGWDGFVRGHSQLLDRVRAGDSAGLAEVMDEHLRHGETIARKSAVSAEVDKPGP